MSDDLPEQAVFNVINKFPDTPETRAYMARHLAWLAVKHRMNRELAGLGPITMTYTERDPNDDAGADTPYIVQVLTCPQDRSSHTQES